MRVLLAIAAAALAASGCTVGLGSAYVGQWRERERVDVEVCIEDEAGRCVEQRQIVSQVPARRFWGFSMGMSMGASSTTSDDAGDDLRLRTGLAAEYLRGRGRLAAGLRAESFIDYGEDMVMAFPLMAMGHVGLSERFALHAGAGVSPLNSRQAFADDPDAPAPDAVTSFAALRALAGLQVVLTHSQQASRMILTIEADAYGASFDGAAYRSLGLVGHIGLFL